MEYKISIVVTARNELHSVLKSTIDTLLKTTKDYDREVILIDDGSSVPVSCKCQDVILIRNKTPLGVSRCRRSGALVAKGDVLVWVDAHMTFTSDWLEQMLPYVDSKALLCSPFWDYRQSKCHCWGADFIWCGKRKYQQHLSPGIGLRHRTKRPSEDVVEVPMVIGACYMMHRSSYNEIGGFSPIFRVWGCDEQDISIRAWIKGFSVKCITNAKVGHLFRASFPYRVNWDDIEFNQLIMVRTLFEEHSVSSLEEFFKPLPIRVEKWLKLVDWLGWRAQIQNYRKLDDEEFFNRFIPELKEL